MVDNIPVPNDQEIADVIIPEIQTALQIDELVKTINLSDHLILKRTLQSIVGIKQQLTNAKQKKEQLLNEFKSIVSKVTDAFKPAVNAYKESEQQLRDKIIIYLLNCHTKRDEILALPEQTQETIQAAHDAIPPALSGLTYSPEWTGEIEDAAAIVDWCLEYHYDELISPSIEKLVEHTNTHKHKTNIPGWKPREIFKLTVTTRKVDMD